MTGFFVTEKFPGNQAKKNAAVIQNQILQKTGNAKDMQSTGKYKPLTRMELQQLVRDKSVFLGDIDTSGVTDMKELFRDCERDDFSGIETWDTSNVTDMSRMFTGVENFNQDIGKWNTSKGDQHERHVLKCHILQPGHRTMGYFLRNKPELYVLQCKNIQS